MSTHGYSGITRWVMGSVTEKVLHHAACPVLVARPADSIRKVLISLDGSELSESTLEPGLEVAAGLGAEVTLLRVVERLDAAQRDYLDEMERGLGNRVQQEFYEDAEEYLHDQIKSYRRAGLNIQTAVRDGSAADRILDFAKAQKVDLIAMATHGRTGLRRWVYGSVTEKVLHTGCCSMLIVR